MKILALIIIIIGMVSAWLIGKSTGWNKGFWDGIKFRNKQLEKNKNKVG